MSEVYLIAMETSKSLEEIRSLYATYMAACQYTLYQPFETVAAAHEEMINEYRRELFADGQQANVQGAFSTRFSVRYENGILCCQCLSR